MKNILKKWLRKITNDGLFNFITIRWWKLKNFLYQHFNYEPEFRFLSEFIHQGDWLLDIGVNMGQYATRMASIVGATGKVIGFEPEPTTYLLAKKIVTNSNIEIYPFGASDRDGESQMALFYDQHNNVINGWSAIITDFDEFRKISTHKTEFISVQCKRIDEMLNNRERKISFIKCDVQGHEVEAISGAIKLIEIDSHLNQHNWSVNFNQFNCT